MVEGVGEKIERRRTSTTALGRKEAGRGRREGGGKGEEGGSRRSKWEGGGREGEGKGIEGGWEGREDKESEVWNWLYNGYLAFYMYVHVHVGMHTCAYYSQLTLPRSAAESVRL